MDEGRIFGCLGFIGILIVVNIILWAVGAPFFVY